MSLVVKVVKFLLSPLLINNMSHRSVPLNPPVRRLDWKCISHCMHVFLFKKINSSLIIKNELKLYMYPLPPPSISTADPMD